MPEPTYIIGIDLGTTNSVLAYTPAHIEKGGTPDIRVMEIPQIVGPGTVENRDILPSFLLVPERHDVPDDALALPWNEDVRVAVGEFARERGAEIPNRLISSAKSWLCHPLVDRNKPILPWEAPENAPKLSPVEASAAILGHFRDAWNYSMAADDEDLMLQYQEVLLTVPASFDAVARELTVQAAEMAGLENVTLLEEPQAAFYAWIEATGESWRESVRKGDLVLVCDIGGGTSDFSLIRVSEENGELALERIAVGEHLLVGGDNMDLALAYSVSNRLAEQGTRLDAWQMRGLWHSCRRAKETLFSGTYTRQEGYPVTILGRGSSLIGNTIKTRLKSETVDQVILNGFFPRCQPTDEPIGRQRTGIREIGLSYESDPAVTRHLASFLRRGRGGDAEMEIPTAILFNGGVAKAGPIRSRILEVFSAWGGEGTRTREIESRDFDLAVARGAAYYGLARRGEGIRIRGGLGKSYYIGVAVSRPAVPGMPVPLKALCVAPFGMEEGSSADLSGREFVLVVGEPVTFDFLASTVRLKDAPGDIVDDWEGEIQEITTIETTLDGEPGNVIPVYLQVKSTEIGTLEIWCVSRENSDRRWKLEFNVREKESFESA
jgi:molecular chaperone DnaK (HSP70)